MRTGRRAAVIATGFMGDTIAGTAAATSLHQEGFRVTLFTRWPQIASILRNDDRFETVVYGRFVPRRIRRPLYPGRFDLVVREPFPWSYREPFTSEIRRRAGTAPEPGYELFLSDRQRKLGRMSSDRPLVSISRDIHKRAFGRDVDRLVTMIEKIAEIRWVGLDPKLHSKHGRRRSIEHDASIIHNSDVFLGPEGGMLWLAAGIGTNCMYLTENIARLEAEHPTIWQCLGSRCHFPDAGHTALPPGCSNERVVEELSARVAGSSG